MSVVLVALVGGVAFGGGLPGVEVSWKKGAGRLGVVAPAGEHVAPEAPVRGWVEQGEVRTEWALPGAVVEEGGLRFGAVQGALKGELRVSLCEDAGTTCRWAEVVIAGEVSGRKGRVLLPGRAPAKPVPVEHVDPADMWVGDPDAAAADAWARARATGGRVLLDFGATWCPPCNLMSAEVLHDPEDAAALSGLVLVPIDADRAASWTLKHRYAVGGYPTLVATDADGRELTRMVGYPGEAALLDWLAAVQDGLDLGALDATTPEVAMLLAYERARQGDSEGAKLALDVALHEPLLETRPQLRRARFLVEPSAEDLHWLLANDTGQVGPVMEWVWDAMDLAAEDAALADALRVGLARVLPRASPLEQADLLWVLAELVPEGGQRKALNGAAAAALQQGLTGDLHRDRGTMTFHARLLADSGDLDGALKVLARGAKAWPDEFTFHYAHAGVLHDAGQHAQAEAPARLALQHAYDDNRLRAARRLAEVLVALDRGPEALAVVDQALAAAVRPGEGINVRTPRYIEALETLRDELGGS